MKHFKLFFVFLFVFAITSVQSQNIYQDINEQLWANFTKAFETLDYNLFEELHTDNMIRINGNGKTISTKAQYINGYKNQWTGIDRKQTISFRFTERIAKGTLASERGIYKLTLNPNQDTEKSYYGKFHVVLKKQDKSWKILVDYDSSENNTIDESSYKQAFAIDDFNKF